MHQYSTEGKLKEPNLAAEAGQGLLSAVTSYARGDMGGVFNSVAGLVKSAGGNAQRADKISKATRTSPADCVRELFSFSFASSHISCRFLGVVVRILRPAQTRKKPEELQAR